MKRLLPYLVIAILAQACTIANFQFDSAEDSTTVPDCTPDNSIWITDQFGDSLEDQNFGRNHEIEVLVSGTSGQFTPYTTGGSFEAESSTTGTFVADDINPEEEVEITLTVIDENQACNRVTLTVPETGSDDTSFAVDGIAIFDPSNASATPALNDRLHRLIYDPNYQRIMAVGNTQMTDAYILGVNEDGTAEINQSFDFANTQGVNQAENFSDIKLDENQSGSYILGGQVLDEDSPSILTPNGIIAKMNCASCEDSPLLEFDTSYNTTGVYKTFASGTSGTGTFNVFQFEELLVGLSTVTSGAAHKLYVTDETGDYSGFNAGQGYPFSRETVISLESSIASTVDDEGNIISFIINGSSQVAHLAYFNARNASAMFSGQINFTSPGVDISALNRLRIKEIGLLSSGRVVAAGYDDTRTAEAIFVGVFESPLDASNPGGLVDYYYSDASASINLSNDEEKLHDLYIDNNDGILVSGMYQESASVYRGFVARFVIDEESDTLTLDDTFGDGKGQSDANGNSLDGSGFQYLNVEQHTYTTHITKDAHGRIIAGGTTFSFNTNSMDWYLYRFYP